MNGQVGNQRPSRSVRGAKVRTGIKREKLTQERLRSLVHYNPETGIFTWLVSSRQNKAGDQVEGPDGGGYLCMVIEGERYLAHRMAFFYMEGYFPENTVDHINRIKIDNRWKNLREATMQCQLRNSSVRKDSFSGIKGVVWNRFRRKWMASIGVDGESKHLGLFSDKLEAAYYRFSAEQCLGFQDCDINSSAKKFIDSFTQNNRGLK